MNRNSYHSRLGLFLLLSSAAVWVHGAPSPPRIFGNKNVQRPTVLPPPVEDAIQEEELELESLKGQGKSGTNDLARELPEGFQASPVSTSTSAPSIPLQNAKKPENEEKPALSDNANSFKFSHQSGGGLADALFSKKSHLSSNPSNTIPVLPRTPEILRVGPQSQNRYKDPSSLVGTAIISSDRDHPNFKLEYTTQDIAEYVFWTNDERGVAMAIGDFLQDGLVDREDAVKFLEDVKRELNSIRERYSASVSQGQQTYIRGANLGLNSGQLGYTGRYSGSKSGDIRSSKREYSGSPEMSNSFPLLLSPEGNGLNRGMLLHQSPSDLENPSALSLGGGGSGIRTSSGNLVSVEELDYEDIAEKLRTVDAKMREYSLEEVIYSLGKDLFAESLKNSPGESIQKFSTFVEAQVASGRIPKDLQKDVLEALTGAFVDAVDERGDGGQQAQVSKGYDGPNSSAHGNIPANLKPPQQLPVPLSKKTSS